MRSILLKTLSHNKLTILIYCLIAIACVWMYVAVYPAIQSQQEMISELLKSFPESFLKAFGVTDQMYQQFEGYLSSEMFNFIWPLMIIILSISWAASLVSGEIEKGTIKILLSLPINRWRIFLGKYLFGCMGLAMFCTISILSAPLLAGMYNIPTELHTYLVLIFLSFLFSMAVFSIAIFLSSFFSERGKVSAVSGGLFLFMYVVNILASLQESLSNLKYVSFFYYFDAPGALLNNTLSLNSILVFTAVTVVFSLLAAYRFTTRDIIT